MGTFVILVIANGFFGPFTERSQSLSDKELDLEHPLP